MRERFVLSCGLPISAIHGSLQAMQALIRPCQPKSSSPSERDFALSNVRRMSDIVSNVGSFNT